MLNIQLEGLDNDTRMKLLPREQELVKELEQNGSIVETYIKLDMSGIFIVMMANDSEDVFNYYMHIWKIFYACYALLPFIR